MENKTLKSCLLIILILIISLGTFVGGYAIASLMPQNPLRQALAIDKEIIPTPSQSQIDTPQDQQALFAPFWESWDLLHQNYVDQPLDDVALMRGAIQGMLAATGDKHTSYMNPDEFKEANTQMDGEYTGIGCWINTRGEYVEIVSPMKGSPAEKAGLRPKDIVMGVNGESMQGIPGELVQKRILGPAGEAVTLTIKRGDESFDVTIVRAKIETQVVDYKMLDNGVAYISLMTFNETATKQLRNALTELLKQNPFGLVFDLRGNGGGYLTTAIEVASEFMKDGVVLYEEYGDGSMQAYDVQRGGRATEIPLVVLINGGSASASEIVAGALQDSGRARLVGETSYGKGSVQSWISLRTEEGGVRITIARWLTPNKKQINEVGLSPDLVVELTEEDYRNSRDPQLDAAVTLLLQK